MRSRSVLLVALLGLAVAVPAPAAPAQERTLEGSYSAADLRGVRLEVAVGEVEVRGGDGDRVEIEVRVRCNRDGWGSGSCPDRARDVAIEDRRRGDTLVLDVEGPGMWGSRGMHLDVRLRMPARLGLELEMEIGEVAVSDLESDVGIDLGIGEVSLRMAEAALASLALDTGIGESSLRAPSRREESAGLFTRTIDWDVDRGRARVRVDLGIGEIDVRLN